MDNLRQLGEKIHIPIPPDDDGFSGRECPVPACLGYFKVQFGTGLKGENLPCHCPYCGHVDGHDKFWTQEQLEYAKSVAANRLIGALIKDLKKHEFNYRPPHGSFGIGISMKVTGSPPPIRYFREKQLETEVVCDKCTLRYAIYGVFAFCPDCGTHNSLQILDKNLDLAEKEIALAANADADLSNYLVSDALENVVSAFDGFGRETCRVSAPKASNPAAAEKISFQNLTNARRQVMANFGIDFASVVSPDEWQLAVRCFQKRHLLAYKMGVVDEAYKQNAGDPQAITGRKVLVASDEVTSLIDVVRKLGKCLVDQL